MPDLFAPEVDLKPVDLINQVGIIPFVTHSGTFQSGAYTLRIHKLSSGEIVVPLDDLRALIAELQP